MTEMVALDMTIDVITGLAKTSIQEKIAALPDSNLMRVDEVVDMLLDLQQELISLTASASESVPAQ
jgi:hypothetical protein